MGRLYLYHPTAAEPENRTAENPEKEWLRFQEARSAADGQLEKLARRTEKEAGEAEAALFEAHRLLLKDAGYTESVRRIIMEEKQNAEAAVSRTGEMLAERFDAMADDCMRERAADLRDVSRRLLQLLCGVGQQEIASDVPVILAAEEQFAAYRDVLVGMGGREVIIRTCDIGADKRAGYLGLPQEENPALGIRAIRVSLDRPEIFKTQLRALYRASVFGRLRIMFPMITGEWEVREAKRLCDTVKKELAAEGIPYSEEVPVGIIIETPAAVMISDRLAKEVDFFSCGTNDLTQYTLACDRQNPALGRFYDARHPAVLRMLKMVCGHAHRNGIRVGVCGELAADPEAAETFLALGVDELSVTPEAVLPLRDKIRSLDLTESREKILEELLSEKTSD